jgi:hypothetical protein
MMGLITGHCHIKGHLLKLGLVDSRGCHRCKQALETALHVLGDCEALAVLRCRHLGHDGPGAYKVLKPGDLADIAVSMVLRLVQSARLLNA